MPQISFRQGANGYTGTVDITLRQASPTSNGASAKSLEVDGDDPNNSGKDVQALLKFTNIFGSGANQIPIGATITSATLTLETSNKSVNGGGIYRMVGSWNAATTWSSTGGIQANGSEAASTPELLVGAAAMGSRAFNVTQSVQAWAKAAAPNTANNGWAFLPTSGDDWIFMSSEGSTKPLLTVNYTTAASLPVLTLSGPASVVEGNSGSKLLTYTVTRAGSDLSAAASVSYAVAAGSAADAADFGGTLPSGTVSFAAGQATRTFTVSVSGDTTVEPNESFTMQLSRPSGAALGTPASVTTTITNDDTSQARQLTLQEGVNGYTGTVDTQLRQANPTTSYATATSLTVDGDDPAGTGNDVQALLKFSNIFGSGTNQIPLGATITSAILKLQVTNASTTGGNLYQMLSDWTASSTWASLGSGVQPNGTEAIANAVASVGSIATGARTFDVTSSVQAWASGQANRGWAFLPSGGDGWDFYSAQGTTKPSLTITYTVGTSSGAGGNVAPSNLTFTPSGTFQENVAGAVAGRLSVTDPNVGDTHRYTVADSRFEVIGDQLKLKDGVRLDFERTPQVTLGVTATDAGGLSTTGSISVAVGNVAETRFAAFGDYGSRAGSASVADLVAQLGVDFIVTVGDNVYYTDPIDNQIGRLYSSYIGHYVGSYGSGSRTDRFFPALGNHEYSDAAGGTSASAYLSYFTLPGKERYYDFVRGPVHFFVLNSNAQEPDGNSSTSVQAQWLKAGLANSTSTYNIVYFHHPSYSSGEHGSSTVMRWPFEQWGATAVLSGHDHDYERVLRDDNGDGTMLPYLITGLGGASLRGFGTPVGGSAFRYNAHFGVLLVQASTATLTFDFIPVGGDGTPVDSYTIDRSAASRLASGADSDLLASLSGDVQLSADTLIAGLANDTSVLASGSGAEVMSNQITGADTPNRIDLSAFAVTSADAQSVGATGIEADVLLRLGDGDRGLLESAELEQLHQAWLERSETAQLHRDDLLF